MPAKFENKVVFISGANGNLGQGVVEAFRAAGAKLALLERGAQLSKGEREMLVSADVTDLASMQAAVEAVTAHFGQIDVFVHTVGGYAAGKPVHELDLQTWDRMMALNARAVFIACGCVAQHMVTQGVKGSIVVVLARAALKGSKNHAAYAASKSAAQRIVESMAAELLDAGIRVNAVLPGTIDTPPNREAMPNADFDKWVRPEHIASAILYLASNAASATSGDSLTVYGRS